jgi:hypothetical protein
MRIRLQLTTANKLAKNSQPNQPKSHFVCNFKPTDTFRQAQNVSNSRNQIYSQLYNERQTYNQCWVSLFLLGAQNHAVPLLPRTDLSNESAFDPKLDFEDEDPNGDGEAVGAGDHSGAGEWAPSVGSVLHLYSH